MATQPALEVVGLVKAFGQLRALDSVAMKISPSAVTGLIGPNGSGKTTLFNAISGFLRPDTGAVMFHGRDITGMPTYRLARMGLKRTFQNTADFTDMSVLQNLLTSARSAPGERLWRLFTSPRDVAVGERALIDRAWELLDRMALTELANTRAADLSIGQGRLLQIARLLMEPPSLLMLDEPSSGLNPEDQHRLSLTVRDLCTTENMTVLVIEHNMSFINAISDALYVMYDGRVIANGPPAQVISNPVVVETYLGAHHATA
ncbi:ABC transporter ATP-binding protein [Mycolicibacterium septicum]|uniref:ABC transporter ATP-binding protein n=1 Tax=Mycolicibacterium septicum TaxID=98668 RepID=UPI0023E140F4|nr:ABC transporter ATP-binding protein [Mycolicibacterium septicum]MDF3336908.1 ABC transporter ATP-binding protein [Mycolicibacterium septicum]